MKTSQSTTEQIIRASRSAEGGMPMVQVCRDLSVSEPTVYRWKKRFGDVGVSELRELRSLRDENRRLKQVAADLTLDRRVLAGRRSEERGEASRPACGVLGGQGYSLAAVLSETARKWERLAKVRQP